MAFLVFNALHCYIWFCRPTLLIRAPQIKTCPLYVLVQWIRCRKIPASATYDEYLLSVAYFEDAFVHTITMWWLVLLLISWVFLERRTDFVDTFVVNRWLKIYSTCSNNSHVLVVSIVTFSNALKHDTLDKNGNICRPNKVCSSSFIGFIICCILSFLCIIYRLFF